jgi:hypothetical protein
MCDYSLHAVASRPAEVGETLVTTTFRGRQTLSAGVHSDRGPRLSRCDCDKRDVACSKSCSAMERRGFAISNEEQPNV